MLRSGRLSSACLACSIPLSGTLAVPARLMGITRSSENTNLCSRCGYHLAIGEIHPICLLQIELSSHLRFGSVELDQLSNREIPALRDQLRSRLEQAGALVFNGSGDRTMLLSAYFNAPVKLLQPELRAYETLLDCLKWLSSELSSLGIDCDWKAALTSGYAELVACEGPSKCVPAGKITSQTYKMVQQAGPKQTLTNPQFLTNLATQSLELLGPHVLNQLQKSDLADNDKVLVLLDSQVDSESFGLVRPAGLGLDSKSSRWTQIGSLLLAAMAAPCAAMVVLAPSASFLGLGALVASLLPLWKAVGMSVWPRVLLTLASVMIAVVNLVRTELVQLRFRQLQLQVGKPLQLPRLQRRRLRLIRWTSTFVLALVAVEGLLRVVVMKLPLL